MSYAAIHLNQPITDRSLEPKNILVMKTDQNLSLNDILDSHINILPHGNIIQSQCLIVQPM